jgi:hypothetical protein
MMEGCRLDSAGSGYGPEAGCFEHGKEPTGFIKRWENYDELLTKDTAPWSWCLLTKELCLASLLSLLSFVMYEKSLKYRDISL